MSSFGIGFATGLPLMLAVGPIALLLLETGLAAGVRRALPAAAGVAVADLTYALVAVIGGRALADVLAEAETALTLVAAVVVAALGISIVRSAHRAPGAGVLLPGAGIGLAGRFWLLTVANPLTIVAFTALVVAGGAAATRDPTSGLGWALGIGAASITVHTGLVTVGGAAGRAVGTRTVQVLRLGGGGLMLALAAALVVT